MNVTARGGYQIIDFAGYAFESGVVVTIPGIWGLIQIDKPLVISNLNLDDQLIRSNYANVTDLVEGYADITIWLATSYINIRITNQDKVNISWQNPID